MNAVRSWLIPLHMLHKNLSEDNSTLPDSDDLLAQEILFLEFSRSEDSPGVLANWLSFTYDSARIELQTDNLPSEKLDELLKHIKQKIDTLDLQDIKVEFAGTNVFFLSLNKEVLHTQFVSLLVTIIFCWLLFLSRFGNRASWLVIYTTTLTVLITGGIIVFLEIPFDIATVMIASVSIGLCIDDSVHFMHNYAIHKKHYEKSQAIQKTLTQISPAIISTSILFIVGFVSLSA